MELRVLRYFLAVAKEESISRAAEVLHMTQPTLSRQLMELEEELGKKLLVRGSRKVTLTEEGVLLRKRGQEIMELVEKVAGELQSSEELISGDICIGGGETDAMKLIAKAAKQMRLDYPQVRFHLYSGNADDVTERLNKGLLDFGILIEPANTSKYDRLAIPIYDTWGLLMRKDSPLAQNNAIRPEQLWGLPLITSRQTLVSDKIAHWMGRSEEKLSLVGTYNLVYNASLMVIEGVGYALTLDKLVHTAGDSALCFRPLEPKLQAELSLVWKKYQVFSPAAKKFLEYVQTQFVRYEKEKKA